MKFLAFIIAMVIVGCGSNEEQHPGDKSPIAISAPVADSEAQSRHETHETTGDSLYVASSAMIPDCDPAAEGRLVYVADQRAFKACSSGAWETVDVAVKGEKGEAGASGANGRDGSSGKDGAAGKDGLDGAAGPKGDAGQDGKDGADGEDLAAPVPAQFWVDAVSGIKWFIGGLASFGYCTNIGYRHPSNAELDAAAANGFYSHIFRIGTPTTIGYRCTWTTTNGISRRSVDLTASAGECAAPSLLVSLCIVD